MANGPPTSTSVNPFCGLDEPDAILAEDVEDRLTKYLAYGNHDVFSVGELFATGYQGVPDIIRTLLVWASVFTDDTNALLRQATETSVLDSESRLVPMINQALVTSDFTLPTIDSVNQSPTWRPFFTALADRHPNSILANALKRQHLLSAADVNKQAFTTPSAFAEEFAKLLMTTVSNQADSNSTRSSAKDVYSRVSALCAYDECTAKVALYVLGRVAQLAEHPLTRLFARRLAQQVCVEAVSQIRTIGRLPSAIPALSANSLSAEDAYIHVARLFILANCVAADSPMRSVVVNALLTVAISSADVGDFRIAAKLDDEVALVTHAYATLIVGTVLSAGHPLGRKDALPDSLRLNPITFPEKAILIRSVCNEHVLEPLLQAAFSVHRRPNPDDALNTNKKRAVCLLLAYARVFVTVDDSVVLARLRSTEDTRQLCVEVGTEFQQAELLVSTCETLKPGCAAYQIKDEMQTLVKAANDPFLARGLLIWATEGVFGGPNLRDLRKTAVIHLAFLSMIADKHVALRQGVIDAIQQAMTRDYDGLEDMEIVEIKSEVMRCISGLIRRGLGLPLVDMFVNHLVDSENVDLSHLRQFVCDLLSTASPPFSIEFTASTSRLVNCDRLQPAIASDNQLTRAIAGFKRQANQRQADQIQVS